jgi:hypothetical protein
MIEQPYPYHVLKEKTHYFFESIGEKSVFKIIQFELIKEDKWNLGFGDLNEAGLIDDTVVTNNHDVHKVIRTVAKIAIDFLAKYPNSSLEINPVDYKRKRLYNSIFQKYFEEITPIFKIVGTFEGVEENYSPSKQYDLFTIALKS